MIGWILAVFKGVGLLNINVTRFSECVGKLVVINNLFNIWWFFLVNILPFLIEKKLSFI